MPEVLAVIQCRFASKRLPGKALLPLAGTPLLALLIRRLKAASLPVRLVLATTQNPEDDLIAAWGAHEAIDVIRGEQDDVLARYLRCLGRFPALGAVRVTADNPLTATQALAGAAEALRQGGCDYVDALTGWITGTGVDGFSAETLTRLNNLALDASEREHINARILREPQTWRRVRLSPPAALSESAMRLTVDTLQDYESVCETMSEGRLPDPLEGEAHALGALGPFGPFGPFGQGPF